MFQIGDIVKYYNEDMRKDHTSRCLKMIENGGQIYVYENDLFIIVDKRQWTEPGSIDGKIPSKTSWEYKLLNIEHNYKFHYYVGNSSIKKI